MQPEVYWLRSELALAALPICAVLWGWALNIRCPVLILALINCSLLFPSFVHHDQIDISEYTCLNSRMKKIRLHILNLR
jgi:hypothetical protein